MKKRKSGQVFLVLLLLAAVIFAGCEGPAGASGKVGAEGITPRIQDGYWWIGDTNTGVRATGDPGSEGNTPYIGQDGYWYIGGQKTDYLAEGIPGDAPRIGDDGYWWIGDIETGVSASGVPGTPGNPGTPGTPGSQGVTPRIGDNGNWWIGDTDTGILADLNYKPPVVIPPGLVSQKINFTEYVGDIPNPDRGFMTWSEWNVNKGGSTFQSPSYSSGTVSGGGAASTHQATAYMAYYNMRSWSDNSRLNASGSNMGVTELFNQYALDHVRTAFSRARASGGTVLPRFHYAGAGIWDDDLDQIVYDPEPTGDCTEPGYEGLNWIQAHYKQLSPILKDYEDIITAMLGATFGPWGEMHSSTFGESPEAYVWLMNTLLEALPASRPILGHAGMYISWYNDKHGTNFTFANMEHLPVPLRDTDEARFGLLNDSYANGLSHMNGMYSDMDSLSEGAQWLPGGSKYDFDRDKVLRWIGNQNSSSCGETNVFGSLPYKAFPSVPYEAGIQGTQILNRAYSNSTYGLWANFAYNEANITAPVYYPHNGKTVVMTYDPVYDGRTGTEYFRDRMGYRLVLREAMASDNVEMGGDLHYRGKIQNVGFGNIVNRKNVYVLLRNTSTGAVYQALTDIDARDWLKDQNTPINNRPDNEDSWRDFNFSVSLTQFNKVVLPGDYEILVKIMDPKETLDNPAYRSIRLANNAFSDGVNPDVPMWDTALFANLIGHTTVTQVGGGGPFVPAYNVGDPGPAGGVIVYVNPMGFDLMSDDQSQGTTAQGYPLFLKTAHYLELAPTDATQADGVTPLGPVNFRTASSTAQMGMFPRIGVGLYNNARVLGRTGTWPAADAANNYNAGGFTDWYVPPQDEIILARDYVMSLAPTDAFRMGMENNFYWSTTENYSGGVFYFEFVPNPVPWRLNAASSGAADTYLVRPMRAF